ncbi:hypothetical protein [Capnocytophaga stomatis]|nr:hypothetical protein [Capnocytophaga stomatis]
MDIFYVSFIDFLNDTYSAVRTLSLMPNSKIALIIYQKTFDDNILGSGSNNLASDDNILAFDNNILNSGSNNLDSGS